MRNNAKIHQIGGPKPTEIMVRGRPFVLSNHPQRVLHDSLTAILASLYALEHEEVDRILKQANATTFDRHGQPHPLYNQTEERSSEKVGRNEPCPCGSGDKHKHCCWEG